MPSLAEALGQARKLHQEGNFQEAEHRYRQILPTDASNADLWILIADACQRQGKLTDAAAGYRKALELRPEAAEAYFQLGSILAKQKQQPEALENYRQAIRLQPSHFDAQSSLGIALAEQGLPTEAQIHLREAVRIQPRSAQAHHNLGVALAELKQFDEAIQAFELAVQLQPDYGAAYVNLGLALSQAGRIAEAIVPLKQGTRLRPQAADAFNNLGLALADDGRFVEAEAAYQKALTLNPRYAPAHANLGRCYDLQGRLDEAVACYQQSLRLDSSLVVSHWNLALAWLRQGDFERGWVEYEWRWQKNKSAPRSSPQPAWDGTSLTGRTILLYMEQGHGDMIQFIRYGKSLKQQGAVVIVECTSSLQRLFAKCPGIDRVVAVGSPLPPFDVQAPLMSLPRLLSTTAATIPAETPYLWPDPERAAHWKRQFADCRELKIGVAWRGNPKHIVDRQRSAMPRVLASLANVPGARLFSLQKEAPVNELNEAERLGVIDLGCRTWPDFMETAAVIANLDLVIAVDTAVAHLAGALGQPVWGALPFAADWRWRRDRNDSPWYPTMRLFRQRAWGDWHDVFDRMAGELMMITAKRQASRITVSMTPGELLDELARHEVLCERNKYRQCVDVLCRLAALRKLRDDKIVWTSDLSELQTQLQVVHQTILQWNDELLQVESSSRFDLRLLKAARQAERQRTILRQQIDQRNTCPG